MLHDRGQQMVRQCWIAHRSTEELLGRGSERVQRGDSEDATQCGRAGADQTAEVGTGTENPSESKIIKFENITVKITEK